jgi:hypothetical protein
MPIARTSLVAAVALAVLALVPGAASAAISGSYAIRGVEIAATSTQGTFVGSATGTAGDHAGWRATVVHQQLSSSCLASATGCAITGGTFELANDQLDLLRGAFTGGGVKLLYQAPGCGVQLFRVTGTVLTPLGLGSFDVVLTHHRVSFFGCRTVGADVAGSFTP